MKISNQSFSFAPKVVFSSFLSQQIQNAQPLQPKMRKQVAIRFTVIIADQSTKAEKSSVN